MNCSANGDSKRNLSDYHKFQLRKVLYDTLVKVADKKLKRGHVATPPLPPQSLQPPTAHTHFPPTSGSSFLNNIMAPSTPFLTWSPILLPPWGPAFLPALYPAALRSALPGFVDYFIILFQLFLSF